MTNLPDIICLSKSLSAGLLPLAITSCSKKIYNAFLSDEMVKGFFHGHTYSANPNSCMAALAGIELLESRKFQEHILRVSESHQSFSQKIKNHPKVKNIRQQGVIFALDLKVDTSRYGNLRYKLFNFFMENGIFLRPLGNTIYILAPFCITTQQLQKIYKTIEEALELV